jgi:hypothetical protein
MRPLIQCGNKEVLFFWYVKMEILLWDRVIIVLVSDVEWSDDVIKGRYIWCDVTALLSLKMTTKVRDWFFW